MWGVVHFFVCCEIEYLYLFEPRSLNFFGIMCCFGYLLHIYTEGPWEVSLSII